MTPEIELKLSEFVATCARKDPQTMHFSMRDQSLKKLERVTTDILQKRAKQLKFNDVHQMQHSLVNLLNNIVGIQLINVLIAGSNGVELPFLLNFFRKTLGL